MSCESTLKIHLSLPFFNRSLKYRNIIESFRRMELVSRMYNLCHTSNRTSLLTTHPVMRWNYLIKYRFSLYVVTRIGRTNRHTDNRSTFLVMTDSNYKYLGVHFDEVLINIKLWGNSTKGSIFLVNIYCHNWFKTTLFNKWCILIIAGNESSL